MDISRHVQCKEYLRENRRFADLINGCVYGGDQVVRPEDLAEVDTVEEIVVPYGDDAEVAVSRYRDLLKMWYAKEAGGVIYALFGVEVQNKVDLGMAVRCGLYDLLGYCEQIIRSKKSYMKKGSAVKDEDGKVRIKLDAEEFLSGLSREDRLTPIVTLVLYLGEDEWKGHTRISDLLDLPDERLRPYTLDYEGTR